MNSIIKLDGLSMENFKNIIKSDISFSDKGVCNNIIGIYGQNGSGKTAVVEAINILKNLMIGMSLQKDLNFYINALSDKMILSYTFKLNQNNNNYVLKYTVKFNKNHDFDNNNLLIEVVNIVKEQLEIFDSKKELIGSIIYDDKKKDKLTLFDKKLLNNEILSKEITNSVVLVAKQLSTSIIFQSILLKNIINSELLKNVLTLLNTYAKTNLFVIGMRETSLISTVDNLVLNIRSSSGKGIFGKVLLNLFKETNLSKDLMDFISPELERINEVINKLVPNIKIDYVKLGDELDNNGILKSKIQLVSVINNKTIPLKYESEGIKKLIALCSVLISVYNDESVCLVVDELDSGVFEYLLGEIVKIIHEGAKGQLIFTSHNLRLLEVLPKQCIIFSTTNPRKRFVKMTNVKPNNNLRDFYYRTILLGGQKEQLYNETDEYEIERALRRGNNNEKVNTFNC